MRLPRNNLPFLLVLSLGTALLGTSAWGDDPLPQPAAPKRYDKLAAHSPFAPPTNQAEPIATPPPPPAPSWTENLTVTSLMQSGNVYTATILEKDSSDHYMVRSDVEDQEHHLEVATVKWADKTDAIKITLRKGTQFGDVHFDPSAAPDSGGSAPSAPPTPVTIRPNMVTTPGAIRPPPGMPAPPNRFPGNNPVRSRPPIRANPGAPMRPVLTPPNPVRSVPVRPAQNTNDDDDDN